MTAQQKLALYIGELVLQGINFADQNEKLQETVKKLQEELKTHTVKKDK